MSLSVVLTQTSWPHAVITQNAQMSLDHFSPNDLDDSGATIWSLKIDSNSINSNNSIRSPTLAVTFIFSCLVHTLELRKTSGGILQNNW
jgi:hypothetical protein